MLPLSELGNFTPGETMPRRENENTPVVISGYLYTNDGANGTVVDTHQWFMWLEFAEQTFSYEGVTFRSELRRKQRYWYGFRKVNGKLRKAYGGRNWKMTAARLRDVAAALHRDSLPNQ